MERLEWESENIQAALQWLLESQKTEAALRLLVALLQFWVRRGQVSEAQSFLERVMEKARHNGTDHDSPIWAKALYAIGVSALHQNNPAQASIYLEKSVAGLTAREREVLDLLSQGMSNKQIAEQLVLSPFTVSRHVQSIYNKLGISSRSAATRLAIEYQLL